MKKYLSLLWVFVFGCFAQPVWAANNVNLGNFLGGQAAFRAFSEDLGSALSYKPITPPDTAGYHRFRPGSGGNLDQNQKPGYRHK